MDNISLMRHLSLNQQSLSLTSYSALAAMIHLETIKIKEESKAIYSNRKVYPSVNMCL